MMGNILKSSTKSSTKTANVSAATLSPNMSAISAPPKRHSPQPPSSATAPPATAMPNVPGYGPIPAALSILPASPQGHQSFAAGTNHSNSLLWTYVQLTLKGAL